jgi:thiosulfate/3-mercaptopyruvate sulfurtransferase
VADIFVRTDWLAEHLLDSNLSLVDVRPPFFYGQAHLPTAVNLPEYLLSSATGGPPAAETLAPQLGEIGISRNTHVVAYDTGDSPAAARLYWVLIYYRHRAVSILDGGITKWRREGRDWEYTPAEPAPEVYETPEPDLTVLTSADEVLASIGSPDVVIVDVRSPAEYLGAQMTARRNGHIPGAINVDWSNNLDQVEGGVFQLKPEDDLRALYESAGVTPDKRIIVHCQSAHRASKSFAVLRNLGYADLAIYSPGWTEWGNRQDTPVEPE